MIRDQDIMDLIIDPDTIDSNLLEGKQSQTGMIDRKHNQDLHILLDALDANVKVVIRTIRPRVKSRN